MFVFTTTESKEAHHFNLGNFASRGYFLAKVHTCRFHFNLARPWNSASF